MEQTEAVHQYHRKRLQHWLAFIALMTVGICIFGVYDLSLRHQKKLYEKKLLQMKQKHALSAEQWHQLQKQYKDYKQLVKELTQISPVLTCNQLLTALSDAIGPSMVLHSVHYTPEKTNIVAYATSAHAVPLFIESLYLQGLCCETVQTKPGLQGIHMTGELKPLHAQAKDL